MRVNSPGADCGATCGAGGTGVGDTGVLLAAASLGALALIELNICVNEPGDELAGAPGPAFGVSAGGAPPAIVGMPTVGSFGGFSIATGLKTRATSSVRPVLDAALGTALELPLAPGMVSACSMRVNSPGLREGSGCAGGAATGSFTGSTATGAGGAAATLGAGGAASGAFGVACPNSDASKSSSARGAADTWPKTPVALDGWSVL